MSLIENKNQKTDIGFHSTISRGSFKDGRPFLTKSYGEKAQGFTIEQALDLASDPRVKAFDCNSIFHLPLQLRGLDLHIPKTSLTDKKPLSAFETRRLTAEIEKCIRYIESLKVGNQRILFSGGPGAGRGPPPRRRWRHSSGPPR